MRRKARHPSSCSYQNRPDLFSIERSVAMFFKPDYCGGLVFDSGFTGSGSSGLLLFGLGTSAPVGPTKVGKTGGAGFPAFTVELIFAAAAFSFPVVVAGATESPVEFDLGADDEAGEADF